MSKNRENPSMKDLITQLRFEHEELMDILNELSNLDYRKPESKSFLIYAKDKLFNHLSKEDQNFFSKFNEKDYTSQKIKNFIKSYHTEMYGVAQISKNFFQDIENRKLSLSEFKTGIARIIFLLKARISWEESMFQLFEHEEED